MYLIDTDVLSLLRRPDRAPGVARWIGRQRDTDLHLSALTLGEISRGCALQRRRDPPFAAALEGWITTVTTTYATRVLPFGPAEARRWGTLCADVGHTSIDLMIAATAAEHGLTVVTRNLRHYDRTGVPTLDPAV